MGLPRASLNFQIARTPIGRRWTHNRTPRAGGAVTNRSPSIGQPNNERANRVRETGKSAGTIGESTQTPANLLPVSLSLDKRQHRLLLRRRHSVPDLGVEWIVPPHQLVGHHLHQLDRYRGSRRHGSSSSRRVPAGMSEALHVGGDIDRHIQACGVMPVVESGHGDTQLSSAWSL
jgi:hypothetical protein